VIGIYDSGIGGITIYQELSKFIDTGKLVYYADYKNSPLGDKSEKEVQEAVAKACEFLFENGCSLVLLACNTATVAAVRYIQNEWLPQNYFGRKVLGIVRPVSEGLLEEGALQNDPILILATGLTGKSGFYEQELLDSGFKNVSLLSMVGLASGIENHDSRVVKDILQEQLSTVINLATIKYLVLACTHYPLVQDQILEIFIQLGGNPDVKIFDQGVHVATKLMNYLGKHRDVVLSDLGGIFFVNDRSSQTFQKQLKEFFNIDGYVLEV
jgi:glutamate racemase